VESQWVTIYTVSQNKTPMQSFCVNFGIYWPILKILLPLHSAMNSGRSFYIICHLTSNLLPHYLVKFECSTKQPFTVVIQFKSVRSHLFSVNIYSDVMISMTCLCWFIYNVTACLKCLPSARRHTLSRRACHLSMDASMVRCSMLNQAFNRCCRNLLRGCDVKWRQWHSEKAFKLK